MLTKDEERFRTALQDAAAVVEKLTPFCKTPSDLVGMINLALENDGQLVLLMQLIQARR